MRLRRIAALTLVAACSVSMMTSQAGAVESQARDESNVVASVVVAPPVDEPVVDLTVAPDNTPAVDASVGAESASDVIPSGPADTQAAAVPQSPSAPEAPAQIAQTRTAGTPSDFGFPPSGVVPILFNDRHIYAKPDELKRGRLLAALVRNNSILVPLRSLFEELGATVSYDPETRTIQLHRRGVDVSLVVGRPMVVIDGETRPLDVPPEIVNGIVLVPVRVCSEVFGAYVQYVPSLHVVAIRYLSPTAPPPAPVATATPVSSPPPTPGPRRIVPPGPDIPKLPPGLETIVVVDTMVSPHVNDEFAANAVGPVGQNYQARLATEFDFAGAGFELDGSYRQYRYAHPFTPGAPTELVGGISALIAPFIATEHQLDIHAGVRLSPEKYYLVVGYASQSTDYGYPTIAGLGAGITKLPALDRPFSYEGSFVYYPNLNGQCTDATICKNAPVKVAYSSYRYFGGLTFVLLPHVFIEAGYMGDRVNRKAGFPADGTYGSIFTGLGARF